MAQQLTFISGKLCNDKNEEQVKRLWRAVLGIRFVYWCSLCSFCFLVYLTLIIFWRCFVRWLLSLYHKVVGGKCQDRALTRK